MLSMASKLHRTMENSDHVISRDAMSCLIFGVVSLLFTHVLITSSSSTAPVPGQYYKTTTEAERVEGY